MTTSSAGEPTIHQTSYQFVDDMRELPKKKVGRPLKYNGELAERKTQSAKSLVECPECGGMIKRYSLRYHLDKSKYHKGK